MSKQSAAANPHLPVPRVQRYVRPLARFIMFEWASGIVLLACTALALALALANLPFGRSFRDLWHTEVWLQIGTFRIGGELGHFFVNDVLMTVFFFAVGLEIKRELVAGELRDRRKAALPVMAAVGGMLVPAGLYMALQWGQPGFRGWGVPMATDIAFVVGVLALLGKRVPIGLKIMLLSLAVADDLGAVVVIAVFYAGDLHLFTLLYAAAGLSLIAMLKHLGVRSTPVYVVIGVGVWLAVYKSGIHPTIAGVLLGLMTPAEDWVSRTALRLSIADLHARLEADPEGEVSAAERRLLAFAARESVSPLERLEHALHPWVGFVVMPLFALANAGVRVGAGDMANPVALAVALGLFLGKPIGVMLFSFLAVKLGVAKLPAGVNWWVLLGGGFLAGIGFTMSLFVANLALGGDKDMLAAGKIGTLAGSVCSVIVGTVILLVVLRKRPEG